MTDHTCYRKCQRCGEVFEQDKLRYCKICGLILCPLCQGAHECKEPEPGEPTGKERIVLPQAYYICSSCNGLFEPDHLYQSTETGELLCHTCYHTKLNNTTQTEE